MRTAISRKSNDDLPTKRTLNGEGSWTNPYANIEST